MTIFHAVATELGAGRFDVLVLCGDRVSHRQDECHRVFAVDTAKG